MHQTTRPELDPSAHEPRPGARFAWIAPDDAKGAFGQRCAAFLADQVDDSYLSDADIDAGRSDGNRNWHPQLADVVAAELACSTGTPGHGDGVHLAACTGHDGQLHAISIVNHAAGADTATVDDIVVDRAARSTGLGRAFIDWLDAELAAVGVTELHLETSAKNPRARALFETLGFVPVTWLYRRPTRPPTS